MARILKMLTTGMCLKLVISVYVFGSVYLISSSDALGACYNFDVQTPKKSDTIRILRVFITKDGIGGAEFQMLSAIKHFQKKGFEVFLLAAARSDIAQRAIEEKIPTIIIDIPNQGLWCAHAVSLMKDSIKDICSRLNINIIHWHKPYNYALVQDLVVLQKWPIVVHYHSHVRPNVAFFKGAAAFVASSPKIAEYVSTANQSENLGIKHITFVHPPCDEARFLNFVPVLTRSEFFKDQFHQEIVDVPLLCCIANFWDYKNHTVLLQAVAQLTNVDKIPVQLILVGDGPLEKQVKNEVARLNLGNCVFFLGFTDVIPEILYYSDIKILPSKHEAFGRVLLEAAFMGKPIILSQTADLAGFLIKHGVTGLLFDSSNPSDLAEKIKLLIRDRAYALRLGENVYNEVQEDFSNERAFEKVEQIYTALSGQKI